MKCKFICRIKSKRTEWYNVAKYCPQYFLGTTSFNLQKYLIRQAVLPDYRKIHWLKRAWLWAEHWGCYRLGQPWALTVTWAAVDLFPRPFQHITHWSLLSRPVLINWSSLPSQNRTQSRGSHNRACSHLVKKSYAQAMPFCSMELGLQETKAYHGPPDNTS